MRFLTDLGTGLQPLAHDHAQQVMATARRAGMPVLNKSNRSTTTGYDSWAESVSMDAFFPWDRDFSQQLHQDVIQQRVAESRSRAAGLVGWSQYTQYFRLGSVMHKQTQARTHSFAGADHCALMNTYIMIILSLWSDVLHIVCRAFGGCCSSYLVLPELLNLYQLQKRLGPATQPLVKPEVISF